MRLILPLWLPFSFGIMLLSIALFPGPIIPSDLFVDTSIVLLLVFLIFLIVRYVVLIWFSYLDYTERLFDKESGLTPFVSLILPAFNEEKLIDQTLESLMNLDYPAFEVIVVDDGSSDETYTRATRWQKRHSARLKVIRQTNLGKAAALNSGIHAAKGEIVFCMDADSTLERQAVRRAVRHFADPSVGAVAGHVQVRNRRGFWTSLQFLEYMEGLNLVRRFQGFFRIVNIIPGPCGAFRKSLLKEIGLYTSDTFAEDCDITLRILERGWKVVYEPRAVAQTEAPDKLLPLLRQRYRWTRGVFQAIKKNARGLLRSAARTPGNLFVLGYMIFEGIFWPILNILAHLLVIGIALFFGFSGFILFWWIQLLILNTMITLYCLVLEKEDLKQIGTAFIYHLFFIFVIDVCKVLSIAEELIDVKMNWNKLERLQYPDP